MNKVFIYITLILITVSSSIYAQKDFKRKIFVRTGIDLSRFTVPYLNNMGPSGVELSLDTEVKYNFFPTIEIGFSNLKDHVETHEYDLEGTYLRIGFNYSITKYKHRLDRDIFFIGVRYGYSGFYHQAKRISITNQWGTFKSSFTKTQLNAHWFEGVIGLRAEVFNNIFMGFTIRLKTILNHSSYNNYTPYWIPGYGEATKSFTTGLSYSILYSIPIHKFKLDFEE